MSWSTRHQLILLAVVVLVLIATGAAVTLPFILKAPTCADGKQNGVETGVDCGGSCQKICSASVSELETLWSRSFRAAPGVYDALAYIENQNFDAGVRKILYRFSLYDADNLLVTERVGKTYITPNGRIPVFESGIRTGERVPKRTFFEFAEAPQWETLPAKATALSLSQSGIRLEHPTTSPRLFVTIGNASIYNLKNAEVTAVLYDEKDNAFAVSRTLIDALPKGSSAEAVFTWLAPFQDVPARIEIVPRVDSFSISF